MTQLSPPSGTATICTIAVLENARQAAENSPKTLLFDAHIYIDNVDIDSNGDVDHDESKEKGTLACLRFFNGSDHIFDDVSAYFIVANVVKVHDGNDKSLPKFASEDLKIRDYSLVGDIVMLIPASLEQAASGSYPFLHASGCITSVIKDTNSHTLTLHLAPEQFTQLYKEYNKKSGIKKTSLPLCTVIDLESKRWKSHVPNFQVGHILTISGSLKTVCRLSEDGKIKHFLLDIDQVNILGKASMRGSQDTISAGNRSETSTPLKRKGLQFGFGQGTPSPVKKPRLSEADSPSPDSPPPPSQPR